jgi:dihydropteroate synthase
MSKYYTRACNFYYGKSSVEMLKLKKALPLHGNNKLSFDTVEILSRNKRKKISIKNINSLSINQKKKIKEDLKKITKKKTFCKISLKDPLLIGILNLTPDSFSDGGQFNQISSSLKKIKSLLKAGCKIIDIGGESTRPGSKDVDEKTEWKRINKLLKKIRNYKFLLSLDTRKTFVMHKALRYKLNVVNDVSGFSYDTKTIDFLKKTKLPLIINHSKGEPKTMQIKPYYKNVLLEIYDFFEKKIELLRKVGIKHNNIILDPGIGFGKNLKHNITIINNISIFHSLGFPVMLGSSRKRFIKYISGKNDSNIRLGGTLASSIHAMMNGVQIMRVHDFNEISQGLKVFKSINK